MTNKRAYQKTYMGSIDNCNAHFDGESLQEAIQEMEKFFTRQLQLVTYQLTQSIWAVFKSQDSLDEFLVGRSQNNLPIGSIVHMGGRDE